VVADPRLGGRTTLARLGGDEFAVLLSVGVRSDVPHEVAQTICSVLAAPLVSIDGVARTGASVGVARGAGCLAGTLMRHADIAMYRAKRTRTGWAEYEPGRDGAARCACTS
jgi:GGDEF domain-containing protein